MEKTWKQTVVGILDVVAALSALSVCVLTILSASAAREPPTPVRGSLFGIAVLFALVGLFALAGGIFALRRKAWCLALAGSIAASLSPLPLGIPAAIMMLFSERVSMVMRVLALVVLGPMWLLYTGLLTLVLLGYTL